MAVLAFLLFLMIAPSASAGTVCVKYGPCPLDLSAFECTDTPRSSFIRRVCYDAPKRFMAIKLNETWYPYCEIDAGTVQGLLSAESAGRFYNAKIRSRGGVRGPFDCRDHPMPNYGQSGENNDAAETVAAMKEFEKRIRGAGLGKAETERMIRDAQKVFLDLYSARKQLRER